MLLFVSFLLFSGALLGAAWYAWSVPRQQETRLLGARLREIRIRTGGGRGRGTADLMIHEEKSAFGFITDFLVWLGPARRLQEYIEQANLKYRAADVLMEASRLPGAPFWLETMAADLLSRGGERETARRVWRRLYDQAEDERLKMNARRHLEYLDADRNRPQWQTGQRDVRQLDQVLERADNTVQGTVE